MNLSEINFPVFRLSKKPESSDGILYFFTETIDLDTNETKIKIRVVDDTTLDPKSLSRRRLLLKEQEVPLYPLKKAVFMLGDFIRLTGPQYWWIDSSGKVFQYLKKQFVPLVCKKIRKTFFSGLGSIVEVEGSSSRFKTLYKVPSSHKYALILKMHKSDIFYGTCETAIKPTRRAV